MTQKCFQKTYKIILRGTKKVFLFELKDIMSITIRYSQAHLRLCQRRIMIFQILSFFCKCLHKIFDNLTVVVSKYTNFGLLFMITRPCFHMFYILIYIAQPVLRQFFLISVVTSTEIKQLVWDKDKCDLLKSNRCC